jgi:hypothetical protein
MASKRLCPGCQTSERHDAFLSVNTLVTLDPRHYLREIKILQNLTGAHHAVRLLDLVRDPDPSLGPSHVAMGGKCLIVWFIMAHSTP